jgi:hypothetical protein
MNKILTKLMITTGMVATLAACGPAPSHEAQVSQELGPVAPLANITWGTTAKFNQWQDQGGLNKFQNNLLVGARVTSIDIDYLAPGPGIKQAHIQVFGTPAETRAATAEICNVGQNQFVIKSDPVPTGQVTMSKNNREYTCYYENTSGRGHIVITSKPINSQ